MIQTFTDFRVGLVGTQSQIVMCLKCKEKKRMSFRELLEEMEKGNVNEQPAP